MKRDFTRINSYLDELIGDIYPQPQDSGHAEWTESVINGWVSMLADCRSVLDVGCGEAFAQPMFEALGIAYTGICIGADYYNALKQGRNVFQMDFNFLEYEENSFDLIFSRHSLEHSPFPLLTLMEWHRVAKSYLCVVLPRPKFWGWAGRNHYGVASASQARFLMQRAGWGIVWEDMSEEKEFRFMAVKQIRGVTLDDSHEEYEFGEDDADESGIQSV